MTVGAGEQLTTLQRVKDQLGVTNATADSFLTTLIKSASAVVVNYCNRTSFAKTLFTETYDGYGKNWMALRQTGPLSVVSLFGSGQPIPAATGNGTTQPFANGYALDGGRITLYGTVFPNCRGSVTVSYYAGFVRQQLGTIPTSPYQIETADVWLEDEGVLNHLGAPMTKVSASPITNQYSVVNGVYTFAAADAGTAVTISYSYVPSDVSDAVTTLVAERYRWKERIGMESKSLGGQETVSFSPNKLPTYVREILDGGGYKRVF